MKVGTDVYRGEQIAAIRVRLEERLRRDGPLAPAEFRDLIGASRKTRAAARMVRRCRVTLRSGDARVLRKAPNRG